MTIRPYPACCVEEAPPQVARPGPSPADLSPDTQEARGPIPAPLCSPAGLRAPAPPPPARVLEIWGAALGSTWARLKFRPLGSLQTRALFLPSSSGVDWERSREAAVHSLSREPAQVSVRGGAGRRQ